MFQLAYLSIATDIFDSTDSEKGIDGILKVANSFNQENDITGMLLFKGGIFLQLLEGDKDIVTALYGKIMLDPRHKDSKIFLKQEENERLFSDWSMAFKEINDLDINLIDKILPWEKIVEEGKRGSSLSNEKILEIFKMFRFRLK